VLLFNVSLQSAGGISAVVCQPATAAGSAAASDTTASSAC